MPVKIMNHCFTPNILVMLKVMIVFLIITSFLGHLLRTGQACFDHYFPSA